MSAAGNGAPGLGATEDAPRQKQPEPIVMDGASSSKVTVEYHDPSGLFPLVQEQLTSRFPLRNLHWKSPSRPLRSIDSLHVDLVPSKDSVHISGVTSSGAPVLDGSQPLAPSRSGEASGEHIRAPSKERRHQIPGLRRTPYLKIYLLRCDDSDTYKGAARKQLREWVKTHTPPSQSSASASQDNHDAFEWMIVHVVLPDTPAASQPSVGTSSSGTAGEKEKLRWTRGTTTIIEKIRADFNISSKSATDRVAQVRVQKDVVPPHMLPATTGLSSPPVAESPQEQDRAWNDVITKFKTLILLSFDQRVSQYEEDIHEKDAQRVLPGWNFCTFFILKEGLARGFESVGLVEDALLGYDELSIGLDTIIREQAKEGNEAYGGVILGHTEELYQQASEILKRSQKNDGERKEPQLHIHDARPIDFRKKSYRDLILSNKISVFDFRCYIFARQMSLLLRLGNAQSSRSDLASKLHPKPKGLHRSVSVDDANRTTKFDNNVDVSEDLLSLVELCTRALEFITFAGRLLREDLKTGAQSHESEFPERFIDNLIQSWTFAALQQILDETATSSLPVSKFLQDVSTESSGKIQSFGGHDKEQKLSFAEPKTMIHPTRSSSLNHGGRSSSADPPYSHTPINGQVVYENGQYHDRPSPGQETAVAQSKSGLQELAASRAQLIFVQRRILTYVGQILGWTIGWPAILKESTETNGLSDVDLGSSDEMEEMEKTKKETSPDIPSITGLAAAAIVSAIQSLEQFRHFYEILSDLVIKHYMAAGQIKAGESILGDLAALRYEMGDYAAASMYFGRMATSFKESRWNLVEGTMLKMNAKCLKKLNRKDEYIRTLLDLLAKTAAHNVSLRGPSNRIEKDAKVLSRTWLDDDVVDTSGVFENLVEDSKQLPKDKTVPMAHYFDDIAVEPYVRHFDDKDGFQLRLQFRHVLEDAMEVGKAKVRLISANSAQNKEVWLESLEPVQLKKGMCRVWLGSNVNITGPYIADRISLEAGRIVFLHESFTKTEATTPLGMPTSASAASLKAAKKARILCFPRVEALQARLYLSHFIHIDRQRSVELEIASGWNDIQRAEIRLKSASAGLRLITADTNVTSGDVAIDSTPAPGAINITDMSTDSKATLQIPYELENILPELSIKVEIDYFTGHGEFHYHSSFTIPIELPLDVNVHDHFKTNALFSKFNIKTANQVPLQVLEVGLEESDQYDVHAAQRKIGTNVVFPKQPLAVTYKITKKDTGGGKQRQSKISTTPSLALSVSYRCLNEDVLDRVQEMFSVAVQNSKVQQLARLLTATFTDRMQHRVLPPQYDQIALRDKLELGSFEDMGWSESLDSLPQGVRDDARKWLQTWHDNNKTILLPSTPDTNSLLQGSAPSSPNLPRHIVITVAVPQIHILHTVSLSVASPEQVTPDSTTIAIAGKSLTAELCIKHSRKWCVPTELASLANIANPDDPIEFVYTIDAAQDIWLVAGARRAHFTVKENEEHKAQITLIPLRTGNVLLPNIEIRPRLVPKADQKEDPGKQLNCEIDYLSYGESVIVVPDVRSSTVGIGEMGSPRSAVLLESIGR